MLKVRWLRVMALPPSAVVWVARWVMWSVRAWAAAPVQRLVQVSRARLAVLLPHAKAAALKPPSVVVSARPAVR
ncbi:hypothetical protein D9M71_800350 [compost metagenome]